MNEILHDTDDTNDTLFERAKRVIPGGVHSPVRSFRGVGLTPRFIESARGAELTDIEGKRFIDYCLSWGPLPFGHQDPEVKESVIAAIERGWTYGACEATSLELAELITRRLSWVEQIRFVNSGTEAVMSALRLARAATGRSRVLKFDGCYHGHVDALLVRAGSGLAEQAEPDSAGVSAETAGRTLVAPLRDLSAVQDIFATHGKEIAAVIIEPLPANFGLLPQTQSFLKGLRDLTAAHGALLIFDEVISGFRLGFGGMAEKTGIRPDLVTYGKIIGGGFPVGAYGGRRDLMELVAPVGTVYQAGTLSGNPVAMAAGLTTLRKLMRDPPYVELERLTERLAQGIESNRDLAATLGFELRVQRQGSIFWPVFGTPTSGDLVVRRPQEIPSVHKDKFRALYGDCLNDGVYFAPSAFEVGFLSTAHSNSTVDRTIEVWERALRRQKK